MKKRFLSVALFLVFGCAGAQPLPDLPSFQTGKGTECAMHCQKMHSWCIGGCVKGEDKGARKTCFDQCGEKLRDCYDLCLVEDRL